MSHLRNSTNNKNIPPHYVSNPHDTCVPSEKLPQHAFYDHLVTYCCPETAFAEGNDIRDHQNLKGECVNHQNVSFYSGFVPSMPC